MADPGGVRMGLGYAGRPGRGGGEGGRGDLPGHLKLPKILCEGQIKFSTAATLPLPPLRTRAGAGGGSGASRVVIGGWVGRRGWPVGGRRGPWAGPWGRGWVNGWVGRADGMAGPWAGRGLSLPGNSLTGFPGARTLVVTVANGGDGIGRMKWTYGRCIQAHKSPMRVRICSAHWTSGWHCRREATMHVWKKMACWCRKIVT